jgi:hypothetical protein
MAYDPVKAHEYYERTKKLKGRQGGRGPEERKGRARGGKSKSNRPTFSKDTQGTSAKVVRLKAKVSKLQSALSEAQAALSKKRQAAGKEEKKRSDGKSTAKEKRASKEWRDKHKSEIASKSKKEGSSGGGSSKKSSGTSVSSLGVKELEARIGKIKSALAEAKRQLSNATSQLGHLAHSDLTSDPLANEHFARFRSAERIPSK